MVRYKQSLTERYAPASVNSMLAAVNRFLKWLGRGDCTVKSLKIQPRSFRERELTREEYYRLLRAAKEAGKERLWLLQTVGTTGIRISELRFITVEAVGQGSARVRLKGKKRRVLLPGKLCGLLRRYAKGQGIRTGSIFITRTGRPLDRSNILHEMKALCPLAQVEPEKVFPHNLRHLFACLMFWATPTSTPPDSTPPSAQRNTFVSWSICGCCCNHIMFIMRLYIISRLNCCLRWYGHRAGCRKSLS